MTSTAISAGIPTGYELTIDFDRLQKEDLQKQTALMNAAAALAVLGTASDPNTSIAYANVDGMGNN